jgi:integrase
MQKNITARLLTSADAQPAERPFEITDGKLKGFTLRVQPSGVRTYIARISRKHQERGYPARITIGKVGEFTPDEARERCELVLGNIAHDRQPLEGIETAAAAMTLGSFIRDHYAEWLSVNRPKTADKALWHLKKIFSDWYKKPLEAITVRDMEALKLARLKAGVMPATVLRDISVISGCLSRAVRLGYLEANPIRNVDKPRIDRSPKVRFLDDDEEGRLREALAARDAKMRAERASANQWRRDRRREPLPDLPHYGDHLTPAVLVTMNTGLRRGELLALKWDDVDLKQGNITVEGGTAKSGHTRHIPLNAEAVDVLTKWKEQRPDADRVFPIDTSFKTAWAALLKAANIERFRWHDLRHHFASRLAQAGVPLNTIRELLGHGSLAMTLRYAHLAPDQRREAVARLVANV